MTVSEFTGTANGINGDLFPAESPHGLQRPNGPPSQGVTSHTAGLDCV